MPGDEHIVIARATHSRWRIGLALGLALMVVAGLGSAIAFALQDRREPPVSWATVFCLQKGEDATANFIQAAGLENPGLPKGLLDSAVIHSVHCAYDQDDLTFIRLDITHNDEPREHWSAVFLVSTEFGSRESAGENLDIFEAHILPRDEPGKPPLARYPAGERSLLAIDPRSSLAGFAGEPEWSGRIEHLSWAE